MAVVDGGRVLLLSMGWDSLCQWYLLDKPTSVYFDLGTDYDPPQMKRYTQLRRDYYEDQIDGIQILLPGQDMTWMAEREQEDAYVPLRNFMLVSRAAAMGAERIILASATEWAPDKRLLFTVTTGLALNVADNQGTYQVIRPYRNYTKARLMRETAEKEGGWEWTKYAYSCYSGTEPECGECHACRRVAEACLAAEMPIRYRPVQPPGGLRSWWEWLGWLRSDVDRSPALGEILWSGIPRVWQSWKAWRRYKKEGRHLESWGGRS